MPKSQIDGCSPWYRWENGDLVLSLRVQPRAKRDQMAGAAGDHMRVQITAPPVDGKANEHLRRLLAEMFGVSVSQVTLLAGERGRLKRVRIHRPVKLPAEIRLG
jgi:uncharacterized protein (TIGR00251 family)